jgi:hypothetical protein
MFLILKEKFTHQIQVGRHENFPAPGMHATR